MVQGVTRQQQRVLSFVQEYIFQNDESPTYGEIAEALGCAKSNVHGLVRRLAERGEITYRPDSMRSIKVLGQHRHTVRVEVPAEPSPEEFETAAARAQQAAANGEDLLRSFWQAMIEPYQREK